MTAMKYRPLPALLLLAVIGSLSAPSFAQSENKPQPGNFDYYLLTLSWAPEFCAWNRSGRTSDECNPNKHMGFVVHGLWPQYNNGQWPQDCASTPPVSSAIVNQMMPIMPGRSLIQHEFA